MNPKEQFAAFEAHVKSINKKFVRGKSSLKALFDKLEKQIKDDKIEALDEDAEIDVIRKAKPDGDEKLDKYRRALESLFVVWNTKGNYDKDWDPPNTGLPNLHIAFHNSARNLTPAKLKTRLPHGNDKFPKLPNQPNIGATYNYLIFYGSHGDCAGGKPTLLSGVPVKQVRDLIANFLEKKIRFKNIVLDCCMTASFIPEFIPLLANAEGNIIASWGPAAEVIAEQLDSNNLLSGAICAFINNTTQGVADILQADAEEVFMPVCIYVAREDKLYRKKYKNMKTSFKAHPSNDQNDLPDLPKMDTYMTSNGVGKIKEISGAELKKLIKEKVTVPT